MSWNVYIVNGNKGVSLCIPIDVYLSPFCSICQLKASSLIFNKPTLLCCFFLFYFCSSNQTPADVQPPQTNWSQFLRTLQRWKGWYSFAPVGVLWSICHVDALLHPSFFALDVCGRLLLVCFLWVAVGGCVRALKCCLWPGQNKVSAAAWSGYHLTLRV